MNINKEAMKFIKGLCAPPTRNEKDFRRFLRLHFFDYLTHMGLENTNETYREYRAFCRGVYGCDLSDARPRKEVVPVETPAELFPEFAG